MAHWREFQKKDKLGSWDLINESTGNYGEKVVTITGISSEAKKEFSDPDKPKEMDIVLHFKECKPMICNSTNSKIIERLYGFNADNWKGKKITLYVKRGVHSPQGKVDALRVREQLPTLSIEDPMAAIAQKAIQEGKRTFADIKKSYTIPSDVEKFLLTPATTTDNEQPTV